MRHTRSRARCSLSASSVADQLVLVGAGGPGDTPSRPAAHRACLPGDLVAEQHDHRSSVSLATAISRVPSTGMDGSSARSASEPAQDLVAHAPVLARAASRATRISAARAEPNALMLRGTWRRTPAARPRRPARGPDARARAPPSARSPARANGRLSGMGDELGQQLDARDGSGRRASGARDLAGASAASRRRAARAPPAAARGPGSSPRAARDREPRLGIRPRRESAHRFAQLVRRCVARAHPEHERGAPDQPARGPYAGACAPRSRSPSPPRPPRAGAAARTRASPCCSRRAESPARRPDRAVEQRERRAARRRKRDDRARAASPAARARSVSSRSIAASTSASFGALRAATSVSSDCRSSSGIWASGVALSPPSWLRKRST